MVSPLLTTKLYIPQARSNLLARPGLIKRLSDGIDRKLTLISAPAGFGKTTLLSAWRTASPDSNTPMAWVSLDEADNDLTRFWDYIIAALQTLRTGVGEDALALLHSPHPPHIEAVLTTLINGLTALEDRFVMVLDDYHVIDAQPIHSAIAFLLDHLPPQMHLVILTRADPPFSLSRLRGQNQMNEIRVDDLRLQAEEATEFLNQIMQLELSAAHIAALETRTEDWIAGLQMAALSMQGQEDPTDFIKRFSGSHRYIFDYLTDEALRQRGQETKDFLLQTAILSRLSASLCNAVTDRNDSRDMIAQLEQANLFIFRLDDDRNWYRYHHLFAQFLLARLLRMMPITDVAELHRRASQWYEEAGFIVDAVEHALSAQDYERAAGLIEHVAYEMANRMEVFTLGRWIEALPEELLLNYPRIVHPYAMVLSLTNRFEEYGRYLETAEQAALANQHHEEAKTILGQVAVQKCIKAFLIGEFDEALELVRRAQQTLPTYGFTAERWELRSIHGYSTLQWLGDGQTSQADLSDSIRLAEVDNSVVGITFCSSFDANAYIAGGQLRQALAAAQRALQAATRPDGSYLPSATYPKAILGRLHYEWNQLDEAFEHLVPAVNPLQNVTGLTTDPLDTTLSIALLRQAQGDSAAAMALVTLAEEHFQRLPISEAFRSRLGAIKARIWLLQGNVDAARPWGSELKLPAADDVIRPINVYAYLTWARIQLAQDAFELVGPVLERLHKWAQTQSLRGFVIESAMLQALSQCAQGSVDTALTHLQEALTLAAPQGYIRLFVDEGEPMEALLVRMKAEQRRGRPKLAKGMSEYILTLLAAFSQASSTQPSAISPSPGTFSVPGPSRRQAPQPLVEPLRPRELEVLQLMGEGFSNREIAQRLVIALGTTKRHAANIYGKLGVSSRTQAVARARELDLLG